MAEERRGEGRQPKNQKIQSDYEEMLRKAKEQPGVADLMEAHKKDLEEYSEAILWFKEYVKAMRPPEIVYSSTNSAD